MTTNPLSYIYRAGGNPPVSAGIFVLDTSNGGYSRIAWWPVGYRPNVENVNRVGEIWRARGRDEALPRATVIAILDGTFTVPESEAHKYLVPPVEPPVDLADVTRETRDTIEALRRWRVETDVKSTAAYQAGVRHVVTILLEELQRQVDDATHNTEHAVLNALRRIRQETQP